MDWILDYLYRTPLSIRVGSESFSAVAETKLDLNFVFAEKTFLVVCLTSVFCGGKQKSDCLCHVGTRSGAVSEKLQNRIGSGVKRNF